MRHSQSCHETPICKQIREYLEFDKYNKGLSDGTLRVSRYCLQEFVDAAGIKDANNISNSTIDAWAVKMKRRGCSARTINNKIGILVTFLKFERDEGVLMPELKLSRIVKQKTVPPKRLFFRQEQVVDALAVADRREWLLIKIAFDTGMRISELAELRLSNISGNRIRIVGKGSRLRFVMISKECRQRLDDWIKRENITDYLWPSHRGNCPHQASNTLRIAMKETFRKAGITDFRPHDLRRSFATDLKFKGLKNRQIQVALGHANEATTEKYLMDLDGFGIEDIFDKKFAYPMEGLR